MTYEQNRVNRLYRILLRLYPRAFQERLGESMQQTFNDLYQEKQAEGRPSGFVLWMFAETGLGIIREHLLLLSPGEIMQTILKLIGSPALISLLILLPFMIMEVVNRQVFNEDFPFMLFFVMWLNLFAVSVILLPIMQVRRTGDDAMANPAPAQANTLLTTPRSAALISIALILCPGILPLLDSIGWLSADRLFKGPNPEVTYLPGMLLSLGLILFPIAAGIVAGRPIVYTLQAGGSLLAHPINLIIVIFILSTFVIGFSSLLIDQWPCFIGVPNCD